MSGWPNTCIVTESPGPSGVNGPTALAAAGTPGNAGTGSTGAGACCAAKAIVTRSVNNSRMDRTPEFGLANTVDLVSWPGV